MWYSSLEISAFIPDCNTPAHFIISVHCDNFKFLFERPYLTIKLIKIIDEVLKSHYHYYSIKVSVMEKYHN